MKIKLEIKLVDKVEGNNYDTSISEFNTELEGDHTTFRDLVSKVIDLLEKKLGKKKVSDEQE